jgi:hypothetical protein
VSTLIATVAPSGGWSASERTTISRSPAGWSERAGNTTRSQPCRDYGLLYHLSDDFSGFEAAAVWDDTKLGLKHFGGWERLAVVSDVEWTRTAVRVFGIPMPGHVRVFHNRDPTEAIGWVCS